MKRFLAWYKAQEIHKIVWIVVIFVAAYVFATVERSREEELKRVMTPKQWEEYKAEQYAEGMAAGADNRD